MWTPEHCFYAAKIAVEVYLSNNRRDSKPEKVHIATLLKVALSRALEPVQSAKPPAVAVRSRWNAGSHEKHDPAVYGNRILDGDHIQDIRKLYLAHEGFWREKSIGCFGLKNAGALGKVFDMLSDCPGLEDPLSAEADDGERREAEVYLSDLLVK